jgi:alkaline phosphatase D
MSRTEKRLSRRDFLLAAAAVPVVANARIKKNPSQTKIAFGSCAWQGDAQPIWNAIANCNPALYIGGGDNVYCDSADEKVMRQAYADLAAIPEWQNFRSRIPIIATWDDHDYGWNDSGAEYPKKHESKEMFLEFFEEPLNSPRRFREGVYQSYIYGHGDESLQIILLDLRWFKTEKTLLGEEQWLWLEDQLQKPARARLLMSSIQFISEEHEWEKWSNLPEEKRRFLDLIDRLQIENLLILSGDMHFGEISRMKTPLGREIYDFTASGLNYVENYAVANRYRLALYEDTPHFGMVNIDWETLILTLELRNDQGAVVRTHDVQLRSLEGS